MTGTRARTGKQKQDGSRADMEHSGPEGALTEEVVDSVTVGNCVLPLCYLLFLLSKRLALNLQKKCVCVTWCSGIENIL